jgi:hypothetical protein
MTNARIPKKMFAARASDAKIKQKTTSNNNCSGDNNNLESDTVSPSKLKQTILFLVSSQPDM